MPPNTVKVDRTTEWGNPFRIGYGGIETASHAVFKFKCFTVKDPEFRGRVANFLRGKNLGCWCKIGAPCHGDVLLEIANR